MNEGFHLDLKLLVRISCSLTTYISRTVGRTVVRACHAWNCSGKHRGQAQFVVQLLFINDSDFVHGVGYVRNIAWVQDDLEDHARALHPIHALGGFGPM